MKSQSFDIAIIGGGITGAGVARDVASRGMSVALVEAGDFAVGTSSRSSKLIHGGLRYLENLEFHLVFEALSERRLLFEMAPHLVHPLRFILPIYEHSRVGMFKMGLGMFLYDVLSMFEAPEISKRLNFERTLESVPSLNSQELSGAYAYYDAYMDDDRLVIETLRSAARWGAKCANYAEVSSSEMKDGKVVALNVADKLTNESFKLKAKHFVSTVGPWTDIFGHKMFDQWNDIMRPSKGIHVTLPWKRLPIDSAVVMTDDRKNRIVFAIPRHEMVIIGTTDTDFSKDPSDVMADNDDIEYILSMTEEFFPGAKIKKDDLIASYAGVRPLVRDESESEGKTSREHLIMHDPRNITFVAGGKYTTYRKMAEEAVRGVLKLFPVAEQVKYSRSHTKEPLNPIVTNESMREALGKSSHWAESFNMSEAEIKELVFRHGMEVVDILSYKEELTKASLWQFEAMHSIKHTMCLNVLDFYLRRSPLFLSQPDHGLSEIKGITDVFGEYYSWNESKKNQEMESVNRFIKEELFWKQG
jgi:glycerol-3-phosphate dehydrogenase